MAELTITINGAQPRSPRERVIAVEAVAEALSKSVGQDPADSIMTLMTAAAHIVMQYGDPADGDMASGLVEAVAHALAAADEFFPTATEARN